MNFVTYYQSLNESCSRTVNEVIITDPSLSLNYKNYEKDYDIAALLSGEAKVSLEADRLLSETDFEDYVSRMVKYYEKGIRLFRIKDLGLLHFFDAEIKKGHFSELKFILNLESGHHNLASIEFYENTFGPILERLLISTEIPFNKLTEITQKLKTPIEIFGLGPILLFYTPRKLLSHQLKQEAQDLWERKKEVIVDATSMESPHSGFEIIQNNSGTLMYAPNHFCLLDYVEKLNEIGIRFFRLDLRSIKPEVVKVIFDHHLTQHNEQLMQEFRQLYPKRFLKGLFVVNKSKVLFKKLKNKRLDAVQDHVALVVEVVKDSHMVIKQLERECLVSGRKIFIQSPDGREKEVHLKWIKNLDGSECHTTCPGHHYIIPIVPAISIKSKISLLS